MTDLGLEVAESVTALSQGESTFFYTLSYEQLSELTSDILVVYADTPETADAFLTESPTADMAQVQEGAVAVVEGAPLVASVSPPTALSLTWGLGAYLVELQEAACAAGGC
jgi:iron complex transport system substrate-binding protein